MYRSGFLPRFLGVWLVVNGVAYMTLSSIGLISSLRIGANSPLVMPFLLGEVAFTFWLLIVGARAPATSGRPVPAMAS